MILSLLLFETEFLNIVSISFTALILNELLMVALEITTWHPYMILAEVATFLLYGASMAFLPEYFGALKIPTNRDISFARSNDRTNRTNAYHIPSPFVFFFFFLKFRSHLEQPSFLGPG